jgi:hypothetical protein
MLDNNEIQRLAGMGNALRPDWPARSLSTFIERNLSARTYADIAVALAWVATRTKTDTPRLLLEAGAWWKAAATEAGHVPRPPRKAEECKTHAGQWANACHGCASDRLAGDRTTPPNLRRPDASNHLARVRAELAGVRANLCGHGIDRNRGKCADCEKTTTTPEPAPSGADEEESYE